MHNVSFFNMPEFEQTTWGKSCHFYSTDSVGSGYTNPLSCSGLSIDITSKNRGYSISAWEHRWAPPPEEKGGFFFFFHKLIMRRVIKTPRNTAREKLFIWNFFYDFLFFFQLFSSQRSNLSSLRLAKYSSSIVSQTWSRFSSAEIRASKEDSLSAHW